MKNRFRYCLLGKTSELYGEEVFDYETIAQQLNSRWRNYAEINHIENKKDVFRTDNCSYNKGIERILHSKEFALLLLDKCGQVDSKFIEYIRSPECKTLFSLGDGGRVFYDNGEYMLIIKNYKMDYWYHLSDKNTWYKDDGDTYEMVCVLDFGKENNTDRYGVARLFTNLQDYSETGKTDYNYYCKYLECDQSLKGFDEDSFYGAFGEYGGRQIIANHLLRLCCKKNKNKYVIASMNTKKDALAFINKIVGLEE